MHDNFADRLKALMADPSVGPAQGGIITKTSEGRFNYAVHSEPEPDGELFLSIHPSAVLGETWKAFIPNLAGG